MLFNVLKQSNIVTDPVGVAEYKMDSRKHMQEVWIQMEMKSTELSFINLNLFFQLPGCRRQFRCG